MSDGDLLFDFLGMDRFLNHQMNKSISRLYRQVKMRKGRKEGRKERTNGGERGKKGNIEKKPELSFYYYENCH